MSEGLTSEPIVKAIRNGAKVAFTSSSLKMFNEDLNILEGFAYAHDEVPKLSGQLLLDTASRLPNLLKWRYLDFLDKKRVNMSHPGFESLRDFVVHEIEMITSGYAQAFFMEEKEGSREPIVGSRDYRVRQVAVDVGDGAQDNRSSGSQSSASLNKTASNKPLGTVRGGRPVGKDKSPPKCFICCHPDSKHFLADCETFDGLPLHEKRQRVVDAKKC